MTSTHRDYLWPLLPHPATINIFKYLSYQELITVGQVCRSWFEASRDDLLWKDLFYRDFKIDRSVQKITGKLWYEEYKRLCYHVPVALTEDLNEHSDQVLHVSFSHNGKYFATCSKDGHVVLWRAKYPATVKFDKNMKEFAWKYTQYSQFNESDTLILVSGVHFGTPYSTSGEIAVFNLQGFQLQCRVVNKPYDIFGTWYSDQQLFSGDLHWRAHLVSCSYLWLNKASQEIDSELVPITDCLYRFYNRNASTIRNVMVARCLPNSENVNGVDCGPETSESKQSQNRNQGNVSVLEHGNPVSHRDINIAARQINNPGSSSPPSYSSHFGRTTDQYSNSIWYNSEYRRVESELRDAATDSQTEDDDDDDNMSNDFEDDTSEMSTEGSEPEITDNYDKYLIFTTGFKTYTPHQIGFKRIQPYVFPDRMDPGPSLQERLIMHEQRKEQRRSGSPPVEPDWMNFEEVADKCEKIDHLIDMHGHIVGMGLSPDHRYLYVNSRSWPTGYQITNPLDPPPIAQEIDIHVIDLVTLKQVGKMFRAHKAYTPNNECYFIFLDVCNEYVASGAEDKFGYLWDRHYGLCLTKFPHTDVVNSVAFNPKDPEMLVTTSDDRSIKVWRSRAKVKKLNLDKNKLKYCVEMRNNRSGKASTSGLKR